MHRRVAGMKPHSRCARPASARRPTRSEQRNCTGTPSSACSSRRRTPWSTRACAAILLLSFDRLSLLLKRAGLPAEALEEIDCAASLGLLDCRDHGIKGHREALRKRRDSLRHALD